MFRYYHIYLVNSSGNKEKYIDTLKALSKQSAEEQTYMKYGSASKYTGWGRSNFLSEEA